MGSDAAPGPEIEGAIRASLKSDLEIILVGDENVLRPALEKAPRKGKISVVHASEVITMHDSPMVAVRKKKDASLLVAMRQVKDGHADAMVSAGNTGATMMAARIIIGPMKGVARSAICQVLPTKKEPVTILDLGANVDCNARHLCEFAEMGVVFTELTRNVENPRVGLLNIGEESMKGNEVAKTVHRNLSADAHVNFIGNVEPKAIYAGNVDVVVCDGFVGNIILKTSEAVADFVSTLVRRELRASLLSQVGALLSLGAYRRLRKKVDPNEHPGAPLLGVNGTVQILHGSCSGRGVANGILGASQYLDLRLNDHIRDNIARFRETVERLNEETVLQEGAAS